MSFFTKLCVKKAADGTRDSSVSSFDPATYVKPKPEGGCRALFIGINYPGQQGELRGCVNDVKMMMRVLAHNSFPMNDIRVLVDTNDIPDTYGMPTKSNIIEGLQWLVSGAKAGDTLFLHYSGHGTQVRDATGDESDGKDEALVPCDYNSNGLITDDDLVRMIVTPLPAGVRLTALLDCCHSGTLMDLPYTWVASEANTQSVGSGTGTGNAPSMVLASNWMNPTFVLGLLSGGLNPQALMAGLASASQRTCTPEGNQSVFPADVIMFSGCRDEQTSADVSSTSGFNIPTVAGPGGAGGACTSALTEVLMSNPTIPFVELLERMRVNLKNRNFTQIPQLSSSKPVDLGRPFCFFGPISTAPAKVGEPNQKLQRKLDGFSSMPLLKNMTSQLPGPLGSIVSGFL